MKRILHQGNQSKFYNPEHTEMWQFLGHSNGKLLVLVLIAFLLDTM